MEYYSLLKGNPAICNSIGEPGNILLSKRSQHRQILHDLTYMWNLKKEKKKKNREQNGDYQRLGSGGKLEIWIEAYKFSVMSKF